MGRTKLVSELTWAETTVSFAAVYLGDHNANCGIREYMNDQAFDEMHQEIKEVFDLGDIPEIIRLMDKHFETHNYTLWHLFKDEQQKVVEEILRSSLQDVETAYRQVVEHHSHFMNFLTEIHAPLPRPLVVAAETVINSDLRHIFEQEDLDTESLHRLINDQVRRWGIPLDKTEIGYKASWKIDALMEKLGQDPDNLPLLEQIEEMLKIISPLQLDLNLWKAQNIFFVLGQENYPPISEKASQGDEQASKWIERFKRLAEHLRVTIP